MIAFATSKQKGRNFADGHGQVMHSNRDWEDSYRQRWQFDKIVRSTHGVNCTGSRSWKIYVKNGPVTRNPTDRLLRALALTCPIMNSAGCYAWRKLLSVSLQLTA